MSKPVLVYGVGVAGLATINFLLRHDVDVIAVDDGDSTNLAAIEAAAGVTTGATVNVGLVAAAGDISAIAHTKFDTFTLAGADVSATMNAAQAAKAVDGISGSQVVSWRVGDLCFMLAAMTLTFKLPQVVARHGMRGGMATQIGRCC